MWCKTKTINKKKINMTYRKFVCVGHLQCHNDVCQIFLKTSISNKMEWKGVATDSFVVGVIHLKPPNQYWFIKTCKLPPKLH